MIVNKNRTKDGPLLENPVTPVYAGKSYREGMIPVNNGEDANGDVLYPPADSIPCVLVQKYRNRNYIDGVMLPSTFNLDFDLYRLKHREVFYFVDGQPVELKVYLGAQAENKIIIKQNAKGETTEEKTEKKKQPSTTLMQTGDWVYTSLTDPEWSQFLRDHETEYILVPYEIPKSLGVRYTDTFLKTKQAEMAKMRRELKVQRKQGNASGKDNPLMLQYGAYAIVGNENTGKSQLVAHLGIENKGLAFEFGEREANSEIASYIKLSRIVHAMCTLTDEGKKLFPIYTLDSLAYISLTQGMDAATGQGGIGRDVIDFMVKLSGIFRECGRIGLFVINPLAETKDEFMSGLRGGSTGVFELNSRRIKSVNGLKMVTWALEHELPPQRNRIAEEFQITNYNTQLK